MPSSRSVLFAATLIGLFPVLEGEEEPVEGPPLLFSRDIVPPEMMSGDRFELAPIARVVDFGYEFELISDYGDFEIRGKDMLAVRIHEMAALERLEEIGKTEAFATSFSEALKNPLVNTWSVAKRPISTVKRIPGGIIRYLQGKLFEVKRGSEKAVAYTRGTSYSALNSEEETEAEPEKRKGAVQKVGSTTRKLSRRHLGFDKAKRNWARKLYVDPYTTNEYLQYELERIAWASTVGSFAAEFAIPTSSVISYSLQAQELAWSKSATELERLNYNALKEMGLDNGALMFFNEMDWFTLSEKTLMVLALEELDVEGRLSLIQMLLEVNNRDEAMLMVRIVKVFASYNRLVRSIEQLTTRRGLAVAFTADGSMILPLTLDYLHWSPEITEVLLSEELKADDRTLWIGGVASAIAKNRLAANDWKLQENCFEVFVETEALP